jgi:hypothetical protein
VDEDQVRPAALEAVDRRLSAVVRTVVDDPEGPVRAAVGLLGHDLPDEAVERGDPALLLGAAHHLAAAHVPRVEIGHGAETLVLVLDPLAATWQAAAGALHLAHDGSLPERFALVEVARSEQPDEAFREAARD